MTGLPISLLDWFAPPVVVTAMLVVTRCSGLFLTAPLLSHTSIPANIKLLFCLVLSLILFSTIGLPWASAHPTLVPNNLPSLALTMGQELLVGLTMGLAANWLFHGVMAAGEMVSTQMGLSVAAALDPTMGAPTPIVGQLILWFALMLFLASNTHHTLLKVLAISYQHIPIAQTWAVSQTGPVVESLVLLSVNLFMIGLLLALPMLALLLLLEGALAFVAKLLPQMNLFMLMMPAKVAAGFWGLGLFLPFAADWLMGQYAQLPEQMSAWWPH